jgi:hypothetical protein
MRTTITLDEDVAVKLHAEARKSGRPFKQVVNDAIRTGLAAQRHARNLPPFVINEEHLFRLRPGFDYDKIDDLFDLLDGPGRLR